MVKPTIREKHRYILFVGNCSNIFEKIKSMFEYEFYKVNPKCIAIIDGYCIVRINRDFYYLIRKKFKDKILLSSGTIKSLKEKAKYHYGIDS